jgi:hypothetical protein
MLEGASFVENEGPFSFEKLNESRDAIRRNSIVLLMGGFLFFTSSHAQNLDLLEVNHSGKSKGMAGAGIATIAGASAFDLNPSGLAGTRNISIFTLASFTSYLYALSSQTTTLPSLTYSWNASRFRFDNAAVVAPVGNSVVVGAAYLRKISPFISNEKRAITGSTMFTQETFGDINAFSVAAGATLAPGLSIGGSLYRLRDVVTSNVRGDFHGHDIDKWARLENTIEGTMVRVGLQGELGAFRGGLVMTAPYDLEVRAKKSISSDNLYANLLPAYDETVWHIPASIGIGAGYTNSFATTVAVDVRFNRFEQTETALNLYEYGSKPTWNDLIEARAGIEFFPFESVRLPVRFGYSYAPQLYASTDAQGINNNNLLQIVDYVTTTQNVIHAFTAGTTFTRGILTIHVGLEYAFLNVVRNVTGPFISRDEYSEKRYTLAFGVEYNAGN